MKISVCKRGIKKYSFLDRIAAWNKLIDETVPKQFINLRKIWKKVDMETGYEFFSCISQLGKINTYKKRKKENMAL